MGTAPGGGSIDNKYRPEQGYARDKHPSCAPLRIYFLLSLTLCVIDLGAGLAVVLRGINCVHNLYHCIFIYTIQCLCTMSWEHLQDYPPPPSIPPPIVARASFSLRCSLC